MVESPLAGGCTAIAALADVTAPRARAATAGIIKLDTFMAFSSHNGASKQDVTSMEERRAHGRGPSGTRVARHMCNKSAQLDEVPQLFVTDYNKQQHDVTTPGRFLAHTDLVGTATSTPSSARLRGSHIPRVAGALHGARRALWTSERRIWDRRFGSGHSVAICACRRARQQHVSAECWRLHGLRLAGSNGRCEINLDNGDVARAQRMHR
jgi:hypothetical protein